MQGNTIYHSAARCKPKIHYIGRMKSFISRRYSLMTDCWKYDPDERPTFPELVERLEELMLKEVDYHTFDKLDESKACYAVQESEVWRWR